MNITIEHLDALLDFQHNATPAEFRKVFGHLGDHLWNKFEATDCNLLKFYSKLDDRNGALLVYWLNVRSQMLQEVLA